MRFYFIFKFLYLANVEFSTQQHQIQSLIQCQVGINFISLILAVNSSYINNNKHFSKAGMDFVFK